MSFKGFRVVGFSWMFDVYFVCFSPSFEYFSSVFNYFLLLTGCSEINLRGQKRPRVIVQRFLPSKQSCSKEVCSKDLSLELLHLVT